VDSFDALNDRYHVSSRLLTNLSENGYTHPTGIQSYGIPILLEVRFSLFQAITALIIFCSLRSRGHITHWHRQNIIVSIAIVTALGSPASSAKNDAGSGVRAVVVVPTRELAHQIHNECLKLAVGRKWRVILFSKSTASTLADKSVRDKVGG